MFLVANRFSHLRVFFAHRAALSLLLAVGAVPMLWAQVTTATISGTAKDRTGAVLPGVTVSAKNVGTGLTRTLVSDEMGRYAAVNLAVGRYEVKAELPGFQTVIRSGIELTVERHAVVDLVLEVGEMSEQVVVTGEAALVDAATSAIGGLVNEQRIVEMPLNGRDWAQLTALEGGVLVQRQAATDSAPRGFGLHLSIGGARPNQNTFLLDGTRINDTANATPGSASNSLLGVDTLKEFTVVTNTYSAEYGVAAGGVVNAVTKSGTNEFHGSVFEFHRNSALDARNFFDRRPNPPPFKRNQFGFSASGPVRKNRTFFLGSYEGLREGLGTTSLARVPTAEARRGVLPTGTVEVHPSVKPYLELYPLPNGQPLGGGVAEFVAAPNRVTTEDYVTGRVDH
ncbi:MAG: carboxypeptidase regulatory-like domain-containing protein, partial [Acidobacteria bacterium]|nr:carboxypeptidase regulatory-like domain-containing protein [Acidobacteriota bacterium]